MNHKPIYSTHIGAASILLIFLVLSLISFASLTLVNSRADYILSQKMQERSIAYYGACHEANAFIAQNDPSLRKNAAMSNELIKNSFPLSQFQTLDVAIKPEVPEDKNSPAYKILEWRVVTHDEDVIYDETLPVMK